jgi:hypothetical protein
MEEELILVVVGVKHKILAMSHKSCSLVFNSLQQSTGVLIFTYAEERKFRSYSVQFRIKTLKIVLK